MFTSVNILVCFSVVLRPPPRVYVFCVGLEEKQICVKVIFSFNENLLKFAIGH